MDWISQAVDTSDRTAQPAGILFGHGTKVTLQDDARIVSRRVTQEEITVAAILNRPRRLGRIQSKRLKKEATVSTENIIIFNIDPAAREARRQATDADELKERRQNSTVLSIQRELNKMPLRKLELLMKNCKDDDFGREFKEQILMAMSPEFDAGREV